MGYLGQLRVDERYRGRWLVSRGFALLSAITAKIRCQRLFASIVDGNDAAAGILVRKPQRGLRRFREVAGIVTLAVRVRRAARGARPTCDDTAPLSPRSRSSCCSARAVVASCRRCGPAKHWSVLPPTGSPPRTSGSPAGTEQLRASSRCGISRRPAVGHPRLLGMAACRVAAAAAARNGAPNAVTPRSSRLPTTTRSCSTRCCATSAPARPHAGSITCSWGSTCATRSMDVARAYPHIAYPSRLYLASWPDKLCHEWLDDRPTYRRHRDALTRRAASRARWCRWRR